jgi:RNA polymerase sigma factor (sigma-70 family)
MVQRAALVRVAALLVSGDMAKAEDVVQTALTKLYLAWPRVRSDTAGAYARRCVVNAAMDDRRSLFSRREQVSAQLPDVTADPQRGDATAMVALLATLPAGMRAAVVLRYVEGLSIAEAADAMGCSEGNVKSQSARGLERLREAMPQDARVQMINATPNDFFLSLAARKKIWEEGAAARQALMREKGIKTPLEMPTGKVLQDQINNSLWINSTDALNWAGGDPEIRAGVLRLLSTIPEVTVANSTTDGQPTLTITAGPAVFGGDGEEVLTVNATTGLPVSTVTTTSGRPAAVYTYHVSRVTLADIKAGKF